MPLFKRRVVSNIFELQPLEIRRLLTTATIEGTTLHIVGTSGANFITINRNSAGRVTVTGVSTQFTPGSQFNQILVEAAGGSDTVLVTSNVKFSNGSGIPCTLAGNDGNDNLTGGRGNDVLSGGDGDDTMDGGVGNDLITGGSNIDTTNYSNRTGALHVTLDFVANDGEVAIGEDDNVQTEEVIGGAGNDTITGSSLDDYLAGGAGADSLTGSNGNDQLTGSSGSDKMYGQSGDDFLLAQNNDRDTVSGGTNSNGTSDLDFASIDPIDVGASPSPAFADGPRSVLPNTPIPANGSLLDSTYGDAGKAIGAALGWDPVASAVDSQGRVYFVGSQFNQDSVTSAGGEDFVVARFTPDGKFDADYGQKTIDFSPVGAGPIANDFDDGVTVDSNDNVLIFGSTSVGESPTEFAIARLTSAGALDSSFNTTGTQVIPFGDFNAEAHDAAVQSDGKIVLIGQFNTESSTDFAVARLLDNGQLDDRANDPEGNFNGNGITALNLGGEFDSFDNATAVAFQSLPSDEGAQRIVVGGQSDSDFALARFNADGTLDSTFGGAGAGFVVTDFGAQDALRDLAVTSFNQIVAVGSSSNFVIERSSPAAPQVPAINSTDAILAIYSPDAAGAPAFVDQPPTSGSVASFNAVVVDSQDRIVVAGTDAGDFAVARYNRDLTVDTTFANGIAHTDFSSNLQALNQNDSAVGLGVLSNGKIVAGGTTDTTINFTVLPVAARYSGEGAPPNQEALVEGITNFIDWSDLHANPPSPLVQSYLDALSPGAQMYQLAQPDSNGNAVINLGSGDDVVTIYNVVAGDGTTNVAVDVNGIVIYYDAATTHRIGVLGNDGNDAIIAAGDVAVPLVLVGGVGNDTLVGAAGNDVLFGGDGDDLLAGAGGADVISAGGGDDTLAGNDGRDILIGGPGRDDLDGADDEDILIAGYTSYDDDLVSLDALSAEWAGPDTNAARIESIRNGGAANGSVVLTTGSGGTVFNDGASDSLTGGADRDWFFAQTSGGKKDRILDNVLGEELDVI